MDHLRLKWKNNFSFVKNDTKTIFCAIIGSIAGGAVIMNVIPFEKLYNAEFIITEPMAKYQYWKQRGNIYNAIGRPKISHTLLWFKHCSARITDKDGYVLEAKQNQLAFMSKGTEYTVEFIDTNDDCEDTVVIHFQMTDVNREDICPVTKPIICIKDIGVEFAILMDSMSEEYKNNVVCIPKLKSGIYEILSEICKKQKKSATKNEYTCIREGIRLLEQNSDLPISEIAAVCGVSECYFRRLFKKYSGESPMDFRQHYRIDKAKRLLLSDEGFTVSEIAEELNFSDVYHFSKTFKKYTNMSPTMYARKK